ncbi:phosphoadenosine phosphosulfate reductase [Aquicoccus sp.]|uniref:phosphoadenosine phosphosulfate reductase n=2 Tax=Aquicoccus sp. TaxID=2055851 RepID=UPI003565E248
MQDRPQTFETPPMADLDKAEWLTRLADVAEEHGHFQPLGQQHLAAFVDAGSTLLVSFETLQGIRALSDDGQPLGWECVRRMGWSSLTLISEGDTWFRDRQVYGYFDRLIDDGFFDEFDTIVFYGAGPCGYAAAAFSVSAPGARVIAIQPQATLDPRVTEWDDRFTEMRRTSFTDRYGYAPDMIDAAEQVFVLYDPEVTLDAMHAALFTRPNVMKLRMRFMGTAIQSDLIDMNHLVELIARAGNGTLDTVSFARLWRDRHDHPPYLRSLLAAIDRQDRPWLATMICRAVLARRGRAPHFGRRLKQLERQAKSGNFEIPPSRP